MFCDSYLLNIISSVLFSFLFLVWLTTDLDQLQKLSDSSSSTPQDVVSPPQEVVRKEKKIAFADEAGGRLCQVRIYEDDEEHLSESK